MISQGALDKIIKAEDSILDAMFECSDAMKRATSQGQCDKYYAIHQVLHDAMSRIALSKYNVMIGK